MCTHIGADSSLHFSSSHSSSPSQTHLDKPMLPRSPQHRTHNSWAWKAPLEILQLIPLFPEPQHPWPSLCCPRNAAQSQLNAHSPREALTLPLNAHQSLLPQPEPSSGQQ